MIKKKSKRGFQLGHPQYSPGSPRSNVKVNGNEEIKPTNRSKESYPIVQVESVKSKLRKSPALNNLTFEDGYYIGIISNVVEFVESINKIRGCITPGCEGRLVVIRERKYGLGGGVELVLQCNGCSNLANFSSSRTLSNGKNLAGYACMVACFISGATYSDYSRIFGPFLGDAIYSDETYRKLCHTLHKPIEELLKFECEVGKNIMKGKEGFGSWKNSCTSSDGAYHIRGHFSQNMTFVVVDYLTQNLIAFKHQCAKGKVPEGSDENWRGTAKAAEAAAALEVFQKLKNEGMNLHTNFQDADSSSKSKLLSIFSRALIIICFGHHNRAFGKQLDNIASKRPGPASEYPCENLKGGCISQDMIIRAKTNHFAIAISSGTSPDAYKKKMINYGKYHSKNVHEWSDGKCDFHPVLVCNCELNCDHKDLKCEGQPYQSKFSISCRYHQNLFELECKKRAEMSCEVIHPELGRGHSNKPESIFSVVSKIRKKG